MNNRSVPSRDRNIVGTQWQLDALCVLLLIGIVFWLVGFVGGSVPTGADTGNWLAIASERLGVRAMSADVSYLPVFPTILAGFLILTDSLQALTWAANLAASLLVVAVYLVARPYGRTYALIVSLIVGFAGAQTEALAWGGYPQVLATAFGFLGICLLTKYYETRAKTHLWFGLTGIALTLATHAMVGGLVGLAVLISTGHWLYMIEPRFGRKRIWIVAGTVSSVSLLVVAGSFLLGPDDRVPTLNPEGETYIEALIRLVRDAPLPWGLLAIGAVGVIIVRYWPKEIAASVATGSSWAIAGLLFFLATGEARALLIVQIGVAILGVLGFRSLLDYLRGPSEARHLRRGALWKPRLLMIGGISMLAALLVGGFGAYLAAKDWYRLVDDSELQALDELRSQSVSGDMAVASIGLHGMPVGWWVEGYAQTPTFSAHDPAFLAFPEEIEQAEIANAFFRGDMTTEESNAVLDETGADFIVVDRRGPDADWLDSAVAQQLTVVDDNSNLVILQVQS